MQECCLCCSALQKAHGQCARMAASLKGQHVQMGTLGAGNHYAEIQVIDKVFDDAAARKMGIDQEGQVGPPPTRHSQKQTTCQPSKRDAVCKHCPSAPVCLEMAAGLLRPQMPPRCAS